MLKSVRERYGLYGLNMGMSDQTWTKIFVAISFLITLIVCRHGGVEKGDKKAMNNLRKEVKKNHKKHEKTTIISYPNGDEIEARLVK